MNPDIIIAETCFWFMLALGVCDFIWNGILRPGIEFSRFAHSGTKLLDSRPGCKRANDQGDA